MENVTIVVSCEQSLCVMNSLYSEESCNAKKIGMNMDGCCSMFVDKRKFMKVEHIADKSNGKSNITT